MPQIDLEPQLISDIHERRAWLEQMLGQVLDTREWTLDIGADPVGDLIAVDGDLRPRLTAAGVAVPVFPLAMVDPVANMTGWRDFLNRLVSLN